MAILAPGRSPLAYGELFDQVHETVRALRHLGVRGRDRVAIVMSNGPEMAVALAAVSAGAICVPLNPAFAADEWLPPSWLIRRDDTIRLELFIFGVCRC